MSSDSEDDCYGNIAQKLQSMKNKYSEDKIETTNLLIADLKESNDNSWRKNVSITSENNCDLSQNSEVAEECTLDDIIARNSKKRNLRSSKRAADVLIDNILPEKNTRQKKTKKTASEALPDVSDVNNSNGSFMDNSSADNSLIEDAPARGKGRGRGRGRQSTPRRGRGRATDPSTSRSNTSRARGSNTRARGKSKRRGGNRNSWASEEYEPSMYDLAAALAASAAMANPTGPIYSVGNTHEYPDKSDNVPLFNSAPKSDVILLENDAELDNNEELSVKVYWQSSEHVKFLIRRYQKLTKIFEHFAEREHVSQDKLFFTYNDRILKSDDTPESINYSIVKFIDGGIINQSVSSIVKNNKSEDGIQLKFQCQNAKKPFVICMKADDTMAIVMMKCAEHLEKPLDKLKFYFDGDLITAKQTARQLELEGGECIDVRIIS